MASVRREDHMLIPRCLFDDDEPSAERTEHAWSYAFWVHAATAGAPVRVRVCRCCWSFGVDLDGPASKHIGLGTAALAPTVAHARPRSEHYLPQGTRMTVYVLPSNDPRSVAAAASLRQAAARMALRTARQQRQLQEQRQRALLAAQVDGAA
jgi:hypothetical protein